MLPWISTHLPVRWSLNLWHTGELSYQENLFMWIFLLYWQCSVTLNQNGVKEDWSHSKVLIVCHWSGAAIFRMGGISCCLIECVPHQPPFAVPVKVHLQNILENQSIFSYPWGQLLNSLPRPTHIDTQREREGGGIFYYPQIPAPFFTPLGETSLDIWKAPHGRRELQIAYLAYLYLSFWQQCKQ